MLHNYIGGIPLVRNYSYVQLPFLNEIIKLTQLIRSQNGKNPPKRQKKRQNGSF